MSRKKRNNNRKKIVILSTFVFVAVFMSIGYSYLSERIRLEGTANLYATNDYLWYKITNDFKPESLKEVGYENGKYAYVGENPDNYIKLGLTKMPYRIISVESDHTIKVANTTVYENSAFDESGNRTSSSTYCTELTNGCNSWSAQSVLTNGTISGSVENSSTISSISSLTISGEAPSYMDLHNFNIGAVEPSSSLASVAAQEQEKTWSGYMGLISLSDALFAASGNNNATLGNIYNSYLFTHDQYFWTMQPLANNSSKVWAITPDKNQEAKYAYLDSETKNKTETYNFTAMQVFYLKANVKYASGDGTFANPYVIQ